MLKVTRQSWASVNMDAIRGAAALIVVAGHARGLFVGNVISYAGMPAAGSHLSEVAIEQISIGHEAVMVFFVLSGYLVGGGVLRQFDAGSWSWSDYIIKRLVRLWVVLIPVILIGVGLDVAGHTFFAGPWSLYAAPPGQAYVGHNTFSAGVAPATIIGNIFFLQGIFFPLAGTNLALWSLSDEFWYYMIFPLVVVVFSDHKKIITKVISSILIITVLIALGLHGSYLFIIWLMGAFVARLPNKISHKYNFIAITLGLSVFLPTVLILKIKNCDLYEAELIIGLVFSIFLYIIKSNKDHSSVCAYSSISRNISKISYTLYLSHLPMLIFLANFLNKPWKSRSISGQTIFDITLAIIIAVIWSVILYWIFESRTNMLGKMIIRIKNRTYS